MNTHYVRLLEELTQLINEEDVQQFIQDDLQRRARKLISENPTQMIPKMTLESSKLDDEPLFKKKNITDPSKQVQNISLRQLKTQNLPKGKFSYDFTRTNKAYDVSQFLKRIDKSLSKDSQPRKKSRSKSKNRSNCHPLSGLAIKSQTKQHRSKDKVKVQQKSKHKGFNEGISWQLIPSNREDKSIGRVKTEMNAEQVDFSYTKNHSHRKNKQGRQILKRLAAFDNVHLASSVSASKKLSKSVGKEELELKQIQRKKSQLKAEKQALEDHVRMLKYRIQQEKSFLKLTNSSIAKFNKKLNQSETKPKQKEREASAPRKKSSILCKKTSIKKCDTFETANKKDHLSQNINEEKYLIMMYETVIKEMKQQLTIQKNEKEKLSESLKQLRVVQKSQLQSIKQKQALSDKLFESLKEKMNQTIIQKER